jgi:hypothetical protein
MEMNRAESLCAGTSHHTASDKQRTRGGRIPSGLPKLRISDIRQESLWMTTHIGMYPTYISFQLYVYPLLNDTLVVV